MLDNIDDIEIIGLIAACLTTYAFLPQVYKTWKTKDVSGFSLPTFSLFFVGILFWLIYGVLKRKSVHDFGKYDYLSIIVYLISVHL